MAGSEEWVPNGGSQGGAYRNDQVICDSGPNEECEGWRQGSGGWVELDVFSIRGVGTAA